jgi:hypothetical protein
MVVVTTGNGGGGNQDDNRERGTLGTGSEEEWKDWAARSRQRLGKLS